MNDSGEDFVEIMEASKCLKNRAAEVVHSTAAGCSVGVEVEKHVYDNIHHKTALSFSFSSTEDSGLFFILFQIIYHKQRLLPK